MTRLSHGPYTLTKIPYSERDKDGRCLYECLHRSGKYVRGWCLENEREDWMRHLINGKDTLIWKVK